jgi:hypothetical protein
MHNVNAKLNFVEAAHWQFEINRSRFEALSSVENSLFKNSFRKFTKKMLIRFWKVSVFFVKFYNNRGRPSVKWLVEWSFRNQMRVSRWRHGDPMFCEKNRPISSKNRPKCDLNHLESDFLWKKGVQLYTKMCQM